MGKLKLTVNEEKTRICTVPEGEFDFLGFTFGRMYSPTGRLSNRTNVLSNDRQGPLGLATVKEEHPAERRKGPWADRPSANLARDHNACSGVEPRVRRLGQLLQCRLVRSSLSSARQLHGSAVASVAAVKTQGQTTPGRDLSTLAPLRALRARTSDPAWPGPVVGEGVMSCPRAGCGRSACPVR